MCQSMGSGGIESGFSDISISGGGGGGFGSGFGFGLSTDIELFSTKSKCFCLFVCMNFTKMPHLFYLFIYFYQLGMLMCGTCFSFCESSISICCSSKMLVMH